MASKDRIAQAGGRATVFGNGGKLGQLFTDRKVLEMRGLGLGSAFVVAGFIMSFFGGGKEPDPNTELLNSINRTVTATYEAVLQVQDELHVIAHGLASLESEIAAAFNALNTEILTPHCISAFGTLRFPSFLQATCKLPFPRLNDWPCLF